MRGMKTYGRKDHDREGEAREGLYEGLCEAP